MTITQCDNCDYVVEGASFRQLSSMGWYVGERLILCPRCVTAEEKANPPDPGRNLYTGTPGPGWGTP